MHYGPVTESRVTPTLGYNLNASEYVHDGEPQPGEDEVEFSDDEQEAGRKRMLKERFFLPFDFLPPFSSSLSILGAHWFPVYPHAATHQLGSVFSGRRKYPKYRLEQNCRYPRRNTS